MNCWHQQLFFNRRCSIQVNLNETKTRKTSSVVDCFSPSLILIPSSSNLSFPLQFRRDEDFFISSTIELNCNQSFAFQMQWTISNGSNSFIVDSSILTSSSELFLPSRTFPFGLYQLTLTMTWNHSSTPTRLSRSISVQINPAGITANLLPLGTSLITRGEEQDLQLNPGLYSVDGDEQQFNAEVNPSSLFFDEWMSVGLNVWLFLSNLRGVEFPSYSRCIDSLGWFESFRPSKSFVFEQSNR